MQNVQFIRGGGGEGGIKLQPCTSTDYCEVTMLETRILTLFFQETFHQLAFLIMVAAVIFVYHRRPGVGVHAPVTLLWLEMRRLVNIKVSLSAKKISSG